MHVVSLIAGLERIWDMSLFKTRIVGYIHRIDIVSDSWLMCGCNRKKTWGPPGRSSPPLAVLRSVMEKLRPRVEVAVGTGPVVM